MAALLEIRNLSFSYGQLEVFRDVTLSVREGEVFTLLGPNGSGKSTLLNCIAGLAAPSGGAIAIDGQPIERYSPRELARLVGYVRQHVSVPYDYDVREYLVMGAAPRIGLLGMPKQADYDRVEQVICEFDLHDLADRATSQLSGGEMQRVVVARALVQDPRILLFDEPTSALDYGNQIRVMRVIKGLADAGYAVIMTTHNPDQPILLGGTVGMLNADGTLTVGAAHETLTSERLAALYGADLHVAFVNEVDRIACVAGKL